ncbi:unnamed protein product [Symbiodinium necroappetens]|uniref:Uncharacterized protein n=1 Tax=Symbiodinium necroappetens TaxID=1628268 RepID=A0A812YY83_9DINO|nr:unnamed protein product [Symbiodinium necroappetens]
MLNAPTSSERALAEDQITLPFVHQKGFDFEAMFSMMVLGFCTGTKLSFARVCVGTYQDSLGDAGLDLSMRDLIQSPVVVYTLFQEKVLGKTGCFFPEGKIISKQIRAESTFCRKAGEWHDVRGGGRLVRDVQVYPRHIRETETHQHMHRTAAVKHHLRKMADRHEMLSTYEHDFGFMTRPKPRDFSEVPARTQRNLSEPPSRASSARSQAGWTGEYGIDSTTHPQFAKTESKLQGFQSSAPLRLSVAGWGDCRWSPKTHPNMIMGMTQKRITLQQTTNIMNLRAPDLPFVSR